MKILQYILGIPLALAVGACRQEVKPQQSFRVSDAQGGVTVKTPDAGTSSTDNATLTETIASSPDTSTPPDTVFIDLNVDYGAELLLVDSQGHETGYDRTVRHTVERLAGASYTDESITDAADDSDDPATGESKHLHFTPTQGGSYTLHVIPTKRTMYRLGFQCKGRNGSAHIAATDLGISSSEEHIFSIGPITNCSEHFVAGLLANVTGQAHPLLTYAFPTSASLHLSGGMPARLVIVYDKDILPSSFTATLNGQVITSLFHPKAGSIESLALPTKRGENRFQLNVMSTRDQANHSTDSFTIYAEQ